MIFTQKKPKSFKIFLTSAVLLLVAGTVLYSGFAKKFTDSALAAGCDVNLLYTATVSGSGVNYEFNVSNKAADVCQSASLTMHYANGETVQSVSPKATAGNYYWQLGNLSTNQNSKIIINTSYAGKDLYTEACATANNGQDDCIVITGTSTNQDTTPVTPPPVEPQPPVTPPVNPVPATDKEMGMWVWTSPVDMNSDYRKKLLDFSASSGVNVLYVTVDDYIAINNLSAGTNKTNKIKNYNSALNSLISEAKARGISIDAEAGWKDWAEASKRNNAYTIIQFVSDFNATQPNKFRKLQFDVEPYLLSYYEKNKASTLTTYVDFISEVTKRTKAANIPLAVVIPHFYDATQKWTPAVKFNNVTDYTFNHILSILNTAPDSDIIVMSYRNFAQGSDGVIQLSEPEIVAASQSSGTKVIVAQETGDVDPSYVTYFRKSKSYMDGQVSMVNNYFAGYSGFDGIAVNYYEPYSGL